MSNSNPSFFQGLNYSLGNEDTTLEGELVRSFQPKSLLTIAGSGGRSLALLGPWARELDCVDLSNEQLMLVRLRELCYRILDYEDFLKFWGYAPYGVSDYSFMRRKTLDSLALDRNDKEFYQALFNEYQWKGILYAGKWEQTFSTLSKIVRATLGKRYREIFDCHNLNEQRDYIQENFPHKRWKAILFLLGNRSVFNALLYKGDFVKKNVPESYFSYYKKAFDGLFYNTLARENFFLNLCFYGKISFKEANPYEVKESIFNRVQKSLLRGVPVCRLQKDIFSTLQNKQYDYVGLSDVPSYFSGPLERDFLQRLKRGLRPGAVVVIRYYLHLCWPNDEGFVDITERFRPLIDKEKVGVYRIKIYQFSGGTTAY